jgi:glycosyltransferase involved in cell wall biosynthesis
MVDDWPFVSIIVPVYNGSRTIDALLTSLLALDYPADRCEILIVDNRSTDDTRERILRYPVTLLEETGIQGSDAARNRGIEAAKGEILAFTDADCVVEPTWLKRLLASHKEPGWGGFSGSTAAYPSSNLFARFCAYAKVLDLSRQQEDFFQPDGMGERLCSQASILRFHSDIQLPTGLISPHTANVAYRRIVLETIGSFDPMLLPTGGDFDLAWRLQTQTDWKIAIVPDAIVYHQHRMNLASFTSMYRSYGGGYAVLAIKHSSAPERTARQLMATGLIVTALTIPAHLFKALMLPLKALGRRPDAVFWSGPLFELAASVYYNYGKAKAARRYLASRVET